MSNSFQKPLQGNVGITFGCFAPLHQGHLDLILRAKKENAGGALVIVCGRDGDKGEPHLPLKTRYRLVREFFADDDLVNVCEINETELGIQDYPHGWDRWMEEVESIYDKAVETPAIPHVASRTWYVGEKEYERELIKRGERVVYQDRKANNPISATMIRVSPLKHWDSIAAPFRRAFSKNILITGTASEGKSTLVADLGRYFGAPFSLEWARDYLEQRDISERELECTDFLALLRGQCEQSIESIGSAGNRGVFFADTDSLVTNMYARFFSEDPACSLTTEDYESVIKPAAYRYAGKIEWDRIFCIVPHGAFVDDHVRFMAHSGIEERLRMFEILRESLIDTDNWDKVVVLDGNYYENFTAVAQYVKTLLES